MNRKLGIALVLGAGLLLTVCYVGYDYYAGNHVEVKPVIQPNVEETGEAPQPLSLADVSTWKVDTSSEVYLIVSTSKEKVNLKAGEVTGDWSLSLKNPSDSKASATVKLDVLDSGNSRRDVHIKGPEYLDTGAYPEAVFASETIENWPSDLKAGQLFQFQMKGRLTIKGISKDIAFAMEGTIEDDKIALEGKTTITFSDFGMKSPSAVFSKTDEEIEIEPRLILIPAAES
ncbi:YceI family protein [Cohnella faecalis]|uniref:YceI family protein n=1 Tax=Cohnella faecalis TaxID=2315694 RepID=A0A398CIB5_9BACL|nr:YceI family protein [Cohnella faecalis]RIE02483.1 YceI family protein [Cohnella faecalis]